MLVENGRISSADIVIERGFILSCWVHLEFSGSGQGLGGFCLGGSPFDKTSTVAQHNQQANLAADFIGGVMAVAEVERWSDMVGKVVRVRRDTAFGEIVAIGHPIKELWYEPRARMAALSKANGEGGDV